MEIKRTNPSDEECAVQHCSNRNKEVKMKQMDYQQFLLEINKLDYGVASFNTYKYEGHYNFYLMVAKKGNAGSFNKIEGEVRHLNMFLDELLVLLLSETL